MPKMSEEETKEILDKNPHLKEYMEKTEKKIGRPDFYSTLPFEVDRKSVV